MKRKTYLLISMIIVGVFFLSACQVALPLVGAVEKTIYVGPTKVECEGEGSQMCLLVKENPDDEYTYFYDQIEGFEYEEEYEYVLRVKEETVENPPAGGSSVKWVLVEVISKVPAEGATMLPIFEGKTWKLAYYSSEDGEEIQVLPGSKITAQFQNGQVTGNAGCNNYFGSYQVEGGTIRFTEIGSTEMFCGEPEGVMEQETLFLQLLTTSASFDVAEDQLTIADNEGNAILVFTPTEPLQLVGTDWRLNFYNDGKGAFISLLSGTEITAQFGEDGKLTGSAGCNTYNATYTLDGEAIEIGPAAITMMFCEEPAGVMEQEMAYLAALDSVARFRIEGDGLIMEADDGTQMLNYSVREQEEATPPPVEGTSDLVGPEWKWVEFNQSNQDKLVVDNPMSYTLEFLPDGKLNAHADCNRASGVYTVDGDQLSIENLASTKAQCPPGSLSDGFLRLLNDVVSYSVEDEFLYLETANQTGQMVFTSSDEVTLPPAPTVTATPAATDTPEQTPTPEATATTPTTPTSPPTVVFEDDFSLDTGWSLYTADTHGFKLADEAYTIYANTRNGFIWSVRVRMDTPADVIVETDAVRIDGPETGYYGAVCRFQSGTKYYALLISESGSYGIAKMDGWQLEFIEQGQAADGVINSDGEFNRVRGDCIGNTLTLYVNGQKLLEVQDDTFLDGKVGLILATFDEKHLEVKYDNFAVYEP